MPRRLVNGLSGCIEGTVKNVVESLGLACADLETETEACVASISSLELQAKKTSLVGKVYSIHCACTVGLIGATIVALRISKS